MHRRRCLCLSHYLVLVVVLISLPTLLLPLSDVKAADPLVTFPDLKLEVAVREAIGKPYGDIRASDLSSSTFTTLSAEGLDIQYLTGLQYCTSLRVLFLGNNRIGDISALAGLTKLTDLRLYENHISNISPLAGLTSLRVLYLANNQVDDISPLASLTSLTYLDLYYNQISEISALASLTNLTDLLLAGNQISDISALAGLTKLTNLYLYASPLSDISALAGLTNLTDVRLGYNQLSDISALADLANLTILYVPGNQISDISALAGLTNLKILHLMGNQISDIQPLVDNPGIASGDVVSLSTNPLSCESEHIHIPRLQEAGVILDWEATNQTPTRPSNRSPLNKSVGVSLTPTLESSTFSDPDTCDKCGASQWQVTDKSGDYSGPVFDSGVDTSHLLRIKTPSLSRDTTYYWRVRHQDGLGAWSEWSAETSFTTRAHAEGGVPVWIWPLLGVGVIAAGAGAFLLLRRKTKPD